MSASAGDEEKGGKESGAAHGAVAVGAELQESVCCMLMCMCMCDKPEVRRMVVEVSVMMHSWVSLQEYAALTDTYGFNDHPNHLQPPPVQPYHYSTGCSTSSLPMFVGVFQPFRAFPEPDRTSSTRKRLSISPVRRAQTPRKPHYC